MPWQGWQPPPTIYEKGQAAVRPVMYGVQAWGIQVGTAVKASVMPLKMNHTTKRTLSPPSYAFIGWIL